MTRDVYARHIHHPSETGVTGARPPLASQSRHPLLPCDAPRLYRFDLGHYQKASYNRGPEWYEE